MVVTIILAAGVVGLGLRLASLFAALADASVEVMRSTAQPSLRQPDKRG